MASSRPPPSPDDDEDVFEFVLEREDHGERRESACVYFVEPAEETDGSPMGGEAGEDEDEDEDWRPSSARIPYARTTGRSGTAPRRRGEQQLHDDRRATARLPSIPKFKRLQHAAPSHVGYPVLPRDLQSGSVTPLDLFQEVLTDEMLRVIAENTNKYAAGHLAGNGTSRPWKNVTVKDLKIWIALTIIMGVYHVQSLPEFWSTDERGAVFKASRFMPLYVYEQIKRYLHVSDPDGDLPYWYSKVEPLASHCRAAFKKLYAIGTDVSVDEMIARFSGRSTHTFRIKNKPTPEGYKILALCEHGYTYDFLFESRKVKCPEVERVEGLSAIGSQVWHLVKGLPANRPFNVYMDNYFSSIPLFNHLRKHKIGACGTVRINSMKFPKELKVPKNARLDWDTTSGKVVDGVLAILWMDNAPVTMLTTIHELEGDEWRVAKTRRRPRETSTNGATVRRVFGDMPVKELPIPKVIDDYNHKMNGVDIADQLRSYQCMQQTARRTWLSLFYWLLDTTIVNLSLLHAKVVEKTPRKEFHVALAWDLIRSATDGEALRRTRLASEDPAIAEPPQKWMRAAFVTKSYSLPESRFLPGEHFPEYRETREACVWCRYMARRNMPEGGRAPLAPQTNLYCEACNMPLCCNKKRRRCFKDFHTLRR